MKKNQLQTSLKITTTLIMMTSVMFTTLAHSHAVLTESPATPGRAEISASDQSTKGLKMPAALLNIKAEGASTTTVSHSNVIISDSWVRPTVKGQRATGAFMKITAKENSKLLSVSSPAAGVAEIHEMKMEKDVMKMAAIPSLDLPAGKAVELKPGSYHVMLMDLKAPVEKGAKVPLTLKFQDAKGGNFQVEVQLDAAIPSVAQPSGGAKHHHH